MPFAPNSGNKLRTSGATAPSPGSPSPGRPLVAALAETVVVGRPIIRLCSLCDDEWCDPAEVTDSGLLKEVLIQ